MISHIIADFLVENADKNPVERVNALKKLLDLDEGSLDKALKETVVCHLYSSNRELDTLLDAEQSENSLIENAMVKVKAYSDLHDEPLDVEHIEKRLREDGASKMLNLSHLIGPGESKGPAGVWIILMTNFGGLIIEAEGLTGLEAVMKWKVNDYV